MIDFDKLAKLPLFTNSLLDWVLAVATALIVYSVLLAARVVVRSYLRRLEAAAARNELLIVPLQVLSRTTALFFIVVAAFLGAESLTVGVVTTKVLGSAITIVLFWQAGLWLGAVASAWIERKRRESMEHNRAAVGSLGIINFVSKVVIWSMVTLLTLENLGVDITALVAGLGVGGIAVALAVQNVLGDLFAALSITLDRPFVVGDFLIVDDLMGSVEYIGIKSTRLRSLSGEQIVMSNSDLLKSRVRNYGRMTERRVVFTTSITYETPIEHIEQIPQIIRKIVEAQPDTRFDRSHFATHAAASLDYETVYYVLSADYNRYMDTQQRINLQLHRALTDLGVEFAYPTQKLYIVAAPGDAAPARSEASPAQTAPPPAPGAASAA